MSRSGPAFLLLVTACATPPAGSGSPTPAPAADTSAYHVRGEAFAGVLAALDLDHDNAVRAAEYTRVASTGVTFADADTDGDGVFSAREAQAMVFNHDPVTFDPRLLPAPPAPPPAPPPSGPASPQGPSGQPGPPTHGPAAHRLGAAPAEALEEALRFEVEELRGHVPDTSLPDDTAVVRAAAAGLASPEGRALIIQLRSAAAAADRTLPAVFSAP